MWRIRNFRKLDIPPQGDFRCCLVAAVALISGVTTLTPGLWSAEGFEFAELSPQTTIQEARKRYPTSAILGRHVHVSEADSHDHVYGIDLSENAESPPSIRIFFERQGRQRQEYPRCEQVDATIRQKYGDPAVVQEFDEEQSRNRRLIWRRNGEELSLVCFRKGSQPLFAAELVITSVKR